jgi:hypothetical protein
LYPAETLARSFETALVSLASAGVDSATAFYVIMTATTYTFGFVIEEQASPKLHDVDLAQFLTPYPHIATAAARTMRHPEAMNESFLVGLDYIIKGSQA